MSISDRTERAEQAFGTEMNLLLEMPIVPVITPRSESWFCSPSELPGSVRAERW